MISILTVLNLLWASPNQLQMRSLRDSSTQSLDQQSLQNSAIIVFQQNCFACRKQVTQLKCLPKNSVRLLGSFSSEKQLRRELQKMPDNLPAFYGDQKILQKLSITDRLTPQILVFSQNKISKILGFTPCEEIKKIMEKG